MAAPELETAFDIPAEIADLRSQVRGLVREKLVHFEKEIEDSDAMPVEVRDLVKASGLPGLQVADSLAALQVLAAAWRARLQLPLIAITGSNGKTTVKEMLASILRQHTKNDFHDCSLSYRGRVGEGERPEDLQIFY